MVRRNEPQPAAALSASRRPLQRIAFRDGASIEVVPVQRIDYLEAQDDYVHVHAKGQKYVKQQTLTELEQMLDPARFVRIHRSFVINVESLQKVEPYAKDSRVVVLRDGTRIPVSRAGFERLKGIL
jgi:two-component system, LytTR family, response regulator